MKLRNKKTGEIHEITEVVPLHDMDKKFVIYSKTEGHNHAYKNLAELNEEWEDAPEEPKEYWYIDYDGEISCGEFGILTGERGMVSIGNHFKTREEAVKALRKLEAWKRLKDKGFRFTHWAIVRKEKAGKVGFKCDEIRLTFDEARQFNADLYLIFGGEE